MPSGESKLAGWPNLCTVSTVNLSLASLQPHSAFAQGIILNARLPDFNFTILSFGGTFRNLRAVTLYFFARNRLLC
jgi:hypothetical protein